MLVAGAHWERAALASTENRLERTLLGCAFARGDFWTEFGKELKRATAAADAREDRRNRTMFLELLGQSLRLKRRYPLSGGEGRFRAREANALGVPAGMASPGLNPGKPELGVRKDGQLTMGSQPIEARLSFNTDVRELC